MYMKSKSSIFTCASNTSNCLQKLFVITTFKTIIVNLLPDMTVMRRFTRQLYFRRAV